MYTVMNYKTKKRLKEDVANGVRVRIFQFNDMFNNPQGEDDYTGDVSIEGPHYPEPHRWYASAKIENGLVVVVK